VYSKYVTIPAGGTVKVTLRLGGHVAMGADYHLEIANQPLINRDQITTHVRAASDWEITSTQGLGVDLDARSAAAVVQPTESVTMWARLARP